MFLAVWLSCALGGLAVPPPADAVRVLVDAPIAARIAANDTAHWKQLGASGFLFRGIYDALDGAPQGGMQDFGPTAPESQLLKEVRLSVAELNAAGIDQNFLRVSIAPDAAWFLDREQSKKAMDFFRGAGIFAARAGLKGIALDLRSSSPIYRFNWRGYGKDAVSSTRLLTAAREFGRRGLRAFIREMPDAELIFLADHVEDAGPVWFSLFEGLVESVGAAESIRLDLALPAPQDAKRFDAFLAPMQGIEERLCGALGAEARKIWQRQGGYAPVLEPLAVREGAVEARLPVEDFRCALTAAKLTASDYVVVRGDYGTWWQLGADAARGYTRLREGGETRAVATPARLPDAKAWDFASPVDAFQRVGPVSTAAGAPYVLLDGTRSAVLFWDAPDKPLAADAGVAGLLTTAIATRAEKTVEVSAGQATPDPASVPLLVRGLPLGAWAAPASVWCIFDAAPAVGPGRVPVRLGVRNVFPGNMEGALGVETGGDISLGVKELPIYLKPGATAVFEKAVQGTFALGDRAQLRIALKTPLTPGVQRSFSTAAHLRARWEERRDGAVNLPPLLVPDGEDFVAVVATEAGDVAGYLLQGDAQPPRLLWQRRYPPPLCLSAWPGRGADGPCVAIGDAAGDVHVLGAQGGAAFEVALGAAVEEVLFADLFSIGRDALLVRVKGGAIVCLGDDGREQWRYTDAGTAPRIGLSSGVRRMYAQAVVPAEHVFLSIAGDPPTLARLQPNGQRGWAQPLESAPRVAPVVLPAHGTQPERVIIALEGGALAVFRGDTGLALPAPAAGLKGEWRWLESVQPGLDGAAPALLAAAGGVLTLLDANLNPAWRAELPGVRGVARADELRGPRLLVLGAGGQLTALGADGKPRWKDTPPLALRTIAGTSLPFSERAPAATLAGSDLDFVHLLELPQ